MDQIIFTFFILVLIIVICRYRAVTQHYSGAREGFVAKPTPKEAIKYGGEILQNKNLLRVGFQESKNAMPWMDAVVYEEARQLELKNNLNNKTVNMLFK